MPTLNDPTRVATSNYYPFITMLADRFEDVLRHVTKDDFFVKYVDTQPLIKNQDVKVIITHRSDSTVKESSENMIRTLSRYVYEQLLHQYSDCTNVKHININIVLEKRQGESKEEVALFSNKGQKPTLDYNVNTATNEDGLRFSFILGYNAQRKKWYLDAHTTERIDEYNEWFKNHSIDFATAKLVSEAKQLYEYSRW